MLTTKCRDSLNVRAELTVDYQQPSDFAKLLVFFQSSVHLHTLYVVGSNVEEMYRALTSYFFTISAAGGLVKNIQGDFLLIKRNGIWDLPKGKIEVGETPEVAAIREVEEECGVERLELGEHFLNTYHTYRIEGDWILKHTYWFRMKACGKTDTTPQVEEGVTRAIWVSQEALPKFLANTYDSIKEVFDVALGN